jgi:PPM family protein phosphatase
MKAYLRYAAASHRGFERENNEDSVYAGRRLLALADGVGGHVAGEVASSIVVRELAALDGDEPGGDVLSELHAAIDRANAAMARHVRDHPARRGMATTVTAILFGGAELGLVHVGDSRAYLLRDGSLSQITRDETLVQWLVDQGSLTPEQALVDPRRSVVLRALDGKPIEPVLERRAVRVDDRYLLCSDGVSDVMPPAALADALEADDPQRGAGRLVLDAIHAGSSDNVSCVVAHVTDRDTGYDIPLAWGAVADAPA